MQNHGSAGQGITGRVIGGKYRILRRIGEGGMGVVYEGEHTGLGRRVAIKLLQPEYARNPDVLGRFQREARAACRIGHSAIIDVFDIDVTETGVPYMVMELLAGEPLSSLLAREWRLPVNRAFCILEQILSALAAAHAAGIVHRDIKPENVFMSQSPDRRDTVKILDFGISKFVSGSLAGASMTQTGSVLGTPLYLAPEQARGERHIDHRADIYAVGVLAYQMLSGQLPIQGDNLQNIIFRIATEPPVPLLHVIPDLPEGVARIVDSALAKDPAFRPPDAMAMLYALGIASGRSVRIARPVTQPPARFEDDSGVVDVRAAAVAAPGGIAVKKRQAAQRAGATPDTATPTNWTATLARRRRVALALGAVAALAAVSALGIWRFWPGLGSSDQAVVPAAPPPAWVPASELPLAAPLPPAPLPAPAPEEQSPAPPELPAMSNLDLRGLPTGAEVRVDGVVHHERPLLVPAGDTEVDISAAAPGYEERSIRVRPDRDRTVRLSLHRRRGQDKVDVPPKPEPKPEAKPEPKPEPKPAPKPEPKPAPKPAPKPSAAEPKPAVKPEPDPKPVSKSSTIEGKGGTKVKADYDDN